MKIKILKSTFVKGEFIAVGEVIDASENDAQYLIGLGKAVKSDEVKPKAEAKSEPVKKKKKLFTR